MCPKSEVGGVGQDDAGTELGLEGPCAPRASFRAQWLRPFARLPLETSKCTIYSGFVSAAGEHAPTCTASRISWPLRSTPRKTGGRRQPLCEQQCSDSRLYAFGQKQRCNRHGLTFLSRIFRSRGRLGTSEFGLDTSSGVGRIEIRPNPRSVRLVPARFRARSPAPLSGGPMWAAPRRRAADKCYVANSKGTRTPTPKSVRMASRVGIRWRCVS